MNLKNDTESSLSDGETFAPEYRDRLRTWLVKMIDSATIPGLCWENEEKTIFRMPWKHAGRQDYNLEEDSKIFMAWAKHSGRYREGIDKPEPIVWKTRLRCALNKMPDIKEIPNRSRLDISEPYRVYQLLPPVHKASQIRRRFYHRSQSQDLNNPKGTEIIPSNASKHAIEQETSSKNGQFPKSFNSTSPLLTSSTAASSPGFWFSPSVKVPLNTPMSTNLLHKPQTVTNTMNQLQSLAQSRYPLMTSLHHPFVPFPSTSIPSLYNSANSLEALKHYGLSPTVNGYMTQMANKALGTQQSHQRRLTVLSEEGEKTYEGSLSKGSENLNKIKSQSFPFLITRESFYQNSIKENSEGLTEKQFRRESGDDTMKELRPLYLRLDESHRQIQALEMDLKQSRLAYTRERKVRVQLEAEKEQMKSRLEQMSLALRELATHITPQNQNISRLSPIKSKVPSLSESEKKTFSTSQNSTSNGTVKREILSAVEQQNSNKSSSNNQRLLLEFPTKTSSFTSRKRPASPLDLTVQFPKKFPDEFFPPPESHSKFPSSSNILYVCRQSSPTRSLSSDDKRIRSPFSSSIATPDSVGVRSRSLSPIPGSTNILQYHYRPGTIQVL